MKVLQILAIIAGLIGLFASITAKNVTYFFLNIGALAANLLLLIHEN